MQGQPWTILSYAFRPFFLLGALFGIVAILLWVAMLHAYEFVPVARDPLAWHAHEMLFGFAGAAIAGFLLTAVATWTGRRPVSGPLLGALVLAWLAGRLAMLAGTTLPGLVVAITELAFPLLLAAIATREIVAGGSRRNFGIAGVVAAFAILDAVFHLGWSGAWPGADRVALYLTAHGLLVLITVIGGRIIPSFTGNWLRLRGDTRPPRSRPWVETLLVPVVVLAGVADSVAGPAPVVGALSIAAAGLHALRLAGWRGRAAIGEPLVLILHVAYAWLPLGYLLLGLAALGLPLPRSAALHALTMGGVGTMILAVATRVALGHTGRALVSARLTNVAYVVLNIAVFVRILSPLAPAAYLTLIDVAASGWLLAFGFFVIVYWPILTRPRPGSSP
ncbi:MAG: NnrS family protein [Chromatiales bacterium]|nr:NnrS family protein [Chromatiales bacterium]